MSRHWTSYFKLLGKGRWSWLALALQFIQTALPTPKASESRLEELPVMPLVLQSESIILRAGCLRVILRVKLDLPEPLTPAIRNICGREIGYGRIPLLANSFFTNS
jgi:hypothetical protein